MSLRTHLERLTQVQLSARPPLVALVALVALASSAASIAACASSSEGENADGPRDAGGAEPSTTDDASTNRPPFVPEPTPPKDAGGGCLLEVTEAASALPAAVTAGEHALVLEAASTSATDWSEPGNEAMVLEILRGTTRVGHVVLHQGQERFSYAMHVGALAAGEALSVRVSDLTPPAVTKKACVSTIALTHVSTLGAAAEGVTHAPVFLWPRKKAFDDLPIVVGWSRTRKSYQAVYTNENGGTVAQCGGGPDGIRAEIGRWGRAFDIEGVYAYEGAGQFQRCTGAVAPSAGMPAMEGDHPRLYYGDGHNRVFESRGGYAGACGSGGGEKADGDIEGWNVGSPGLDPVFDDPFTIVLRPLPVDLDALGFATMGGRREALADTYAPWLYRLTDSELAREGRIDGVKTFPMSRYLFVDVYADDVAGSGDSYCSPTRNGGFVLRAVSSTNVVSNGPQMTADYFGGSGVAVKRLAIPLAAGVSATDVKKLVFDAYDDDGIYWLAVGDAFVPRAQGKNGATLDYVVKGKRSVNVYVDDGNDGCVGGVNTKGGLAFPCVGTAFELSL